jgi:hypothetical protein
MRQFQILSLQLFVLFQQITGYLVARRRRLTREVANQLSDNHCKNEWCE